MNNNLAALHNASADRGVRKDTLAKNIADDVDGVMRRRHNNAAAELEDATKRYKDATSAIFEANARMQEMLSATGTQTKTAVSKAKDQAAQLGDALNRVTKILGPDFEKRVQQLVTLTDCLERLNALRQSGAMAEVLGALAARK